MQVILKYIIPLVLLVGCVINFNEGQINLALTQAALAVTFWLYLNTVDTMQDRLDTMHYINAALIDELMKVKDCSEFSLEDEDMFIHIKTKRLDDEDSCD